MTTDPPPLAEHPALRADPRAYGLALALAESAFPGRFVHAQGAYDVLDTGALTAAVAVVSTGEGVLLSIVRSLAGEGPVDLSRVDALDRRHLALVAEGLAALAGR